MEPKNVLATFLVAVFGVNCVVGSVPDMGSCLSICTEDQYIDFDFDEFATKEGGSWKYQLVPKLDFFNPIKYAGVLYTPTGVDGEYNVKVYNILKSGIRETFSDGRLTYLGNNRAINNASETGEGQILFQTTYLKYVPGEYLYYYVCARDGGDDTTDYRNVLVHKKLHKNVINALIKLDKKYGFKNELLELDVEPDITVDVNN